MWRSDLACGRRPAIRPVALGAEAADAGIDLKDATPLVDSYANLDPRPLSSLELLQLDL